MSTPTPTDSPRSTTDDPQGPASSGGSEPEVIQSNSNNLSSAGTIEGEEWEDVDDSDSEWNTDSDSDSFSDSALSYSYAYDLDLDPDFDPGLDPDFGLDFDPNLYLDPDFHLDFDPNLDLDPNLHPNFDPSLHPNFDPDLFYEQPASDSSVYDSLDEDEDGFSIASPSPSEQAELEAELLDDFNSEWVKEQETNLVVPEEELSYYLGILKQEKDDLCRSELEDPLWQIRDLFEGYTENDEDVVVEDDGDEDYEDIDTDDDELGPEPNEDDYLDEVEVEDEVNAEDEDEVNAEDEDEVNAEDEGEVRDITEVRAENEALADEVGIKIEFIEDKYGDRLAVIPKRYKDWSQWDLDAGPPPTFTDMDFFPLLSKKVALNEYPIPLDFTLQKKKEKELKKQAEKEAKLAKFLAKKKIEPVAAAPSGDGDKEASWSKKGKGKVKPPATAEVEREKEKGPSASELIQTLESIPPGSKKPVDGKLPDAYDPKYVEATWYKWWVAQGFFKPEYGLEEDQTLAEAIEERGKFVMVIPPPNVTGTLHLGHALTCAFEDVLIRWNRMCGKVTLWVPGCDHAGIATQMVVERALAKQGISRHALGREEFIKRVWEWKEQKGVGIYQQMFRLGISADWDRTAYTMDPKLSKAVTHAFVTLFDQKFIYRSDRLVNWSCTLKSCISDIEVDKVELTGRTLLSVPGYTNKVEFGVITAFAYKVDDENQTEILVATTRPETMLGDVAIAVHPKDERYKSLVGKKAKHPFLDRELIILEDDFVDMGFGTGAVKITPAHDANDYEVGKRHNLEFITVIDEDGNMTNCGKYSGMKRFDARVQVLADLEEAGLHRASVDNPMFVPMCSRSKDIVEPLLKLQWYVKCDEMAKTATQLVESKAIQIKPDLYTKTWKYWMEGIRDWCISRQLWWGHQIPAYRVIPDEVTDGEEVWVAAPSEEEALTKAKALVPSATDIKLIRDEDVLDTWFSSGLFPLSVFGWPDIQGNEDFQNFYPTTLLETGYDILFFWVARMVFFGTTLAKQIPFTNVFLHSIVRDAHGRKMSKSLGNVIDPVDVIRGITLDQLHKTLEEGNLDPKEIEKAKQGQKKDFPNGIPECGTDALRFALCAIMTQGRDINLDVLRIQGYRFFCNKIWNAVKFSMYYFSLGDYKPSEVNPVQAETPLSSYGRMDRWILNRLGKAIEVSNEALSQYNFQEVTTAIYNFWLYELCDVYLECLKPLFSEVKPGKEVTLTDAQRLHLDVLLLCIETGLRLLAPFMPYLTEELWQRLPKFPADPDSSKPSISVTSYPKSENYSLFESEDLLEEVSTMNKIIKTIRSTRATYKLPNKTKTEVFVINKEPALENVLKEEETTICALAYSNSLKVVKSKAEVPFGTAAAVASDKVTVYILLKGLIDLSKEEGRIQKQISTVEASIAKLKDAMSNKDYSDRVPADVQEMNSTKLTTLEGEILELNEALTSIREMINEQ